MPNVLPSMDSIIGIIVESEINIPATCKDCRFCEMELSGEWYCINNKKIYFHNAKPNWCPLIVEEE